MPVSVGVLLVALFGFVALDNMPIQLTPEVQTPTISIRTDWPGASPQEYEKEIIDQQEEYLRSVEGVTRMSSSAYGPAGRITLEFAVGTNMNEALLKVNSQLQQVPDYPEDADEPVITTSNFDDEPIAWFILSPRPPSEADFEAFVEDHPELADRLQPVRTAHNPGLASMRLRELAEDEPAFEELLPPKDRRVIEMRRFVEDGIESAFERVDGVARSDVHGGLVDELQVIVDPHELAARGLTIVEVRDQLRGLNDDLPGGFFDEGKRRWFVRTLGRFRTPEQVEDQLLTINDGAPVYVGDVADVRLGFKDPSGLVRRFGSSVIAVSVVRESGANVLEVMHGLRSVVDDLNDTTLKQRGLRLDQIYDETDYIYSALDLVQSNIFVGGALTMIVLMAFLHMGARTVLAVPLIVGSALAATYVSPWFFAGTLALIVIAGFWFARGALVVGLVIPTSVVGTFLMMNLFGRSLNVISLAGLAFAIGMLVDNAIVVLENVYRHYDELGESPVDAAVRGTKEVWGAVLASTLTTIAIFLPIVFIEQEAGQLFRDIALAITAAIALSLLVSITVIPTATARLFRSRDGELDAEPTSPVRRHDGGNGDGHDGDAPEASAVRRSTPSASDRTRPDGRLGRAVRGATGTATRGVSGLGGVFVSVIVGLNGWIQKGVLRQLAVVALLVGTSLGLSYAFWPDVEYLPTGNRNQIVANIRPPIGYNYDEMMEMGSQLEENLRPYWDVSEEELRNPDRAEPVIEDYYYVVDTYRVFVGLKTRDPARAAELIPIVRRAAENIPGTFVVARQSSLFQQGSSGGREIEVDISGPDLERLTAMGRESMDILADADPDTPGAQPLLPGGQARANPELDLNSPEVHVVPRPFAAEQMDVLTSDLGYAVDALVDGAYSGDYYLDGDRIDLEVEASRSKVAATQDLEGLPIATPLGQVVPIQALADVIVTSGPEQIDHREGMRAVSIEITPPHSIPLQEALRRIESGIVAPLRDSGQLDGAYRIDLAGTADKLRQAWDALGFNFVLALVITYLLMAALFHSWLYPFVIILSVPLGAVGGILGLQAVNGYLALLDSMGVPGIRMQQLDVLTMLGFVILIGTVVNNPILIVHQTLNHIRDDGMTRRDALLESVRTRIRPIFMTTTTTLMGLLPLVLFPGAGSELYRGLGAVVLGGLVVSTVFTLFLVPSLFNLTMSARETLVSLVWGKAGEPREERSREPRPDRPVAEPREERSIPLDERHARRSSPS